MFARFDENPAKTLQDIKKTICYGRHLELQREITLIELAPSPYFFVLSICLAYMNMFARFDENPAKTLQDIKKQNVTDGRTDGRTDARTDGQRENSIPHHKQSLRGV